MQFIERSSFALRAAIYRLRHPGYNLEFTLFPMIHIGSPEYYEEIRKRLSASDAILFEGVQSWRVNLLTMSYTLIAKRKDLGLVTQRALRLSDFRDKLVHADVTPEEFERGWITVPWYLRIPLVVIAPFYGLYRFALGTREGIAKGLEIDDLPSREEILMWDDDFESVDKALLNSRDAELLGRIEEYFHNNKTRSVNAAIVYGAAHMRATIRLLTGKLRYRVLGGDWLTVFDLI